jgi:antitoxin PrlF
MLIFECYFGLHALRHTKSHITKIPGRAHVCGVPTARKCRLVHLFNRRGVGAGHITSTGAPPITLVMRYSWHMQKFQTKLTSQGQVSVPAAVRKILHLTAGSVLVWSQDGNRIVVDRSARRTTADVHHALFPGAKRAPVAKTLQELKQGIRLSVQRRHAGR